MSLTYLLAHKITTQNQQNWLAKLMGHEIDIVYKPKVSNNVADVFSCVLKDEEGGAKIIISRPCWQEIEVI